MARRSKQMGKSVHELTRAELLSERHRCRTMIGVYGNKIASKLLRKRLHEVEKRIARESDSPAADS